MPALVVRALTLAIGGRGGGRAVAARAQRESTWRGWDPLASDQILLVAAHAWTSLEAPAEALALS